MCLCIRRPSVSAGHRRLGVADRKPRSRCCRSAAPGRPVPRSAITSSLARLPRGSERSAAHSTSTYSGSIPAAPSSACAAAEDVVARAPAAATRSAARSARLSAGARSRSRRRQVGVAGAEREAVRLADGRAHLDAHRDVEVAHQPPDHERLLVVLLAEVGDVGSAHVEQLGDDRRDAAEVAAAAAARGAAQHVGEPSTSTAVEKPSRIDLRRAAARTAGRRRPRPPRRHRRPRRADSARSPRPARTGPG